MLFVFTLVIVPAIKCTYLATLVYWVFLGWCNWFCYA